MLRSPVCLILAALTAAPAAADQFVLSSGGRIEGRLLNPEEKPRKTYQIQTDVGLLTLSAERVEEVIAASPQERDYAELLPKMPPTADGNWRMAKWCQQNSLNEHRRRHLEAVISLDPNHADARRALGYSLDESGNKWILPEVVNRQQGLVRHGSRWVVPVDVTLQKLREERELRQKELRKLMKTWRTWIVKPRSKKEAEGRRQFLALRNPDAVPGLNELLREKDEPRALKILYIEALHRIGSAGGAVALIKEVLETKEPEVRDKALDALQDIGRQHAIAAFGKTLHDSDNRKVNLAAVGLAAMNDRESVPALIDALVTKHKFQLRQQGGALNPVFGGPGGGLGGLNMGGNKPKIIEKTFSNENVRDALVKLTGVNHGFDQQAWRHWLIRRDAPVSTQLRRSE